MHANMQCTYVSCTTQQLVKDRNKITKASRHLQTTEEKVLQLKIQKSNQGGHLLLCGTTPQCTPEKVRHITRSTCIVQFCFD
jgi:hypothetical protein